tara:strand:- start:5854 stop:7368 length:1515 start_codon:yes stop_codon:yes gene_type:complete
LLNQNKITEEFDLLIIGGGINGTGVARDASGRGLRVLLCEKDDLAQGTSSSSTKLVHGGLRYLENFDFKLVRESLVERETLLKSMPHIIWPLRFILPHHSGLRPYWLIRLGLLFYDYLGARKILKGTKSINFFDHESGKPLRENFTKGFEYSDCWVDDSRMVVLNSRDAKENGAKILTRTLFDSAERSKDFWNINLINQRNKKNIKIKARSIINCAGPWVQKIIENNFNNVTQSSLRLIRGSHIVTKKLISKKYNYIFQNSDGRVIFVIPYEDDYTLIGTTDVEHHNLDQIICTDEEKEYLLNSINKYFNFKAEKKDIVWSFSGVRPLFDDQKTSLQKVTRDYVIKTIDENSKLPLVNVFGGKITTYRKLSEKVINELKPYLNIKNNWTKNSKLPGGNFEVNCFENIVNDLKLKYTFLDDKWSNRLVRSYGTEAFDILADSESILDLGINFGWNLTEKEVIWLIENEWAESSDDILWRRSKIGLRLNKKEVQKLDSYLNNIEKP